MHSSSISSVCRPQKRPLTATCPFSHHFSVTNSAITLLCSDYCLDLFFFFTTRKNKQTWSQAGSHFGLGDAYVVRLATIPQCCSKHIKLCSLCSSWVLMNSPSLSILLSEHLTFPKMIVWTALKAFLHDCQLHHLVKIYYQKCNLKKDH